MKEKLKEFGESLLDRILYCLGCFLWILYEVIYDTVKGIIDFFVAGFFLYISLGIILGVVALVLWSIAKPLLVH